MTANAKNAITDVPGIQVGHAQDDQALTGCTVILAEHGAVGGVDQRGGAPGTRETDLLRPMHLVHQVHAILLAGGSAFGLDAAAGVMRYLEEREVGVDTGLVKVPIVPSAILYDLAIGNASVRPNAAMGYQACQNASDQAPAEGCAGAGTGATVGKILGPRQAMKSGIGTASMGIGRGVIVGAIVAVNTFGDVVDPSSGQILAGARTRKKDPLHFDEQESFLNTLAFMKSFSGRKIIELASWSNTVIGVVATNARLDKEQANKMAQMAQDGLARVIRPAHTMLDGDTIFALATGEKSADVNIVGTFAAEVCAQAIIRGVLAAVSGGGLPSARDFRTKSTIASAKAGKG